MFSPLAIFVLIASAVIALTADIFNPLYRLITSSRGKTVKQFKDEASRIFFVIDERGNKILDEEGVPEINWKRLGSTAGPWCVQACFFYAMLLPLSYVIWFVIEPYFAIAAITRGIGNVFVAYAMMIIIAIKLFSGVVSFSKGIRMAFEPYKTPIPRPGRPEYDNVHPDAQATFDRLYNEQQQQENETILLTNPKWLKILFKRVFLALPDLYLLYLLVLILWK